MQASAADGPISEPELMQIERAHPSGLTSAQIIQIFQSRGVRFSEATFRKYVQMGLLPRSRRVGSKGKHRGSRGVYPSVTIRRINSIKGLMASSFTIEEIQLSLKSFKDQIDAVETAMSELFGGFEREIAKPKFDRSERRALDKQLGEARRVAGDLVRQMIRLESRVAVPDKSQRMVSGGILG